MSYNSYQENDQQSENYDESSNAGNDEQKGLSFKDWKSMKVGSSTKSDEAPKNKKNAAAKDTKRKTGNDLKGNRRYQDNYDRYGDLSRNGPNYFAGNEMLAACFRPPTDDFNNFNGGMNNFNCNYDMRGNFNNNFGFSNNGLSNNNNNGTNNNFNRQNNFVGNNFNKGFNNFNGTNNNFNRPNNFGSNGSANNFNCNFNMRGNNNIGSFNNSQNNGFNNRNNFGGNNGNSTNPFSNNSNNLNGPNNVQIPDNFFASDGIFRQKDLMQKPLDNPFRDDRKAKELLDDFDKSRYTYDDKKKKKGKNKTNKGSVNQQQESGNANQQSREPEVFIKNPKARSDGKAFIPKPNRPEENLEITKDEKKQQWKEYREAMKPFKNREFYNAKRVVQRLGKKPLSELEEKEIIRLQNAHEIMAVHKARLTEKYGTYEKATSETSEMGELYLLKKKTSMGSDYGGKSMNKNYQNTGNFGESDEHNDFESGRKILGGYSGFRGFVSGGMLAGTSQRFNNQ